MRRLDLRGAARGLFIEAAVVVALTLAALGLAFVVLLLR